MEKSETNISLADFRELMKRLNFVEDIGYYTRKFTRIYIEKDGLYIGHIISKNKTKIEYKDLSDWIKYFDRI